MDQSKVCQHLMQNRAQSLVLNPPSKGFLHDRLVAFNRFIDDTLHSSSPLPWKQRSYLKHKTSHSQSLPKQKKHTLSPSVSKLLPNLLSIPKSVYRTVPSNQSTSNLLKQKKTPASHVFLVNLAPPTFSQPISREGLYKDTVPLWRASLIRHNKVLELRGKCCEVVPSGQKCHERNFGRWWRCFILTPKSQGIKNTEEVNSIYSLYVYWLIYICDSYHSILDRIQIYLIRCDG